MEKLRMETETATLKDVLELEAPPDPKPLMEEMLEELRNRDAFERLIPMLGTPTRQKDTYMVGGDVARGLKALDEKIEKLRQDIFQRDGALPKELIRTMQVVTRQGSSAQVRLGAADSYTIASQVPTATLEHIRSVADAMGFAVVPWEYLHEDYRKLRGADAAVDFADSMAPGFTSFVLAPVGAYDVMRRVRAKDDLPVYFANGNATMMALEMATPVLRLMWGTIEDLGKKTELLEETVKKHAAQINLIEQRAAEERAANARRELAARAFRAQDPLIFAVPRGVDVRTASGRAVIGPCWGDRMEVAVFEACGLKVRR